MGKVDPIKRAKYNQLLKAEKYEELAAFLKENQSDQMFIKFVNVTHAISSGFLRVMRDRERGENE